MSLEESASGITPKNVLIPPIRIDVPKGVKIGLIYIYIYNIERESCATHYCLLCAQTRLKPYPPSYDLVCIL